MVTERRSDNFKVAEIGSEQICTKMCLQISLSVGEKDIDTPNRPLQIFVFRNWG